LENVAPPFEPTQEYLEKFRTAVDARDESYIRHSLQSVPHEDVSALLEEFDAEESKFVLELLDKEVASDVIEDLDEDTRTKFLTVFRPEDIAVFIEEMETDDAADILNDLPIKVREEVIANLENKEKVNYIIELLRYDEDCAGGLMAKELIRANVNWNVVQCVEEIRRQAENVEKIYSIYVVDDNDKLLGRVSLMDIIIAKPSTKIADIFNTEIISVFTYQKEDEIAEIIQKYDLEAIPVVNVQGKLVGRITVDDIIDVITELADQEIKLMAGIAEDVEEDDNVWVLSRARLPWLVIGLLGGLIGARFIGVFEDDLMKVASLAFFIPLIIATGGNVGIQSSALVVQSLASISTFESSAWKKFIKTIFVAVLNGVVLASLVYAFIFFSYGSTLAFVVGVALFSVVMLASLLGTMVPLILDKIGFNPALASGPFITTTIDLMGLAVYFVVAHLLYNF
jgi:magnesium transporter